ncbi:hypothetical protein CASFOL_038840 [Castilleja foliolosa]|uniref:Leucine-rich repeat-containing N-terminal plant-type domain-containing protein n=1 Tax=Castilleja foliolosa TaxID=1961234 RepID=A0ABD3BIL4_9LAMI
MGDWMDRVGMALVWLILLLHPLSCDALNALKESLTDPNNVLESWDPSLTTPCTWFHVTCCNNDEKVTRVDLGNTGLSAGTLVTNLKEMKSLQYLELYNNALTGTIPSELGEMTSLVSIDLYMNEVTGDIPDTLGNLKLLRFFRLDNNKLTGHIHMSMTNIESLEVIDLSNNDLTGVVPINGSLYKFTPVRVIRICATHFSDNAYLGENV